jgi:putative ABC transport system permease protein
MKTPLAWLNIKHQWLRSLVAVAGIAFAVTLVFLQMGFQASVEDTATLLYDHLRFDVLLVSAQYVDVNQPGLIPRSRLYQAESVDGVESARPFYVGFQMWRTDRSTGKDRDPSGKIRALRYSILVLGFRPGDPVFKDLPGLENAGHELERAGTVLLDRESRDNFKPRSTGKRVELGARDVEIVGLFRLGSSFGANGTIITSDQTFARLVPGRSPDQVSLGLVTLRRGADRDAVIDRLRSQMQPQVLVLPREQVLLADRKHWRDGTSVGVVTLLGLIVAVIVGVIFVYQVISSDLVTRRREFATLKAIGYTDRQLARVVVEQAVIFSLLGYLPGFGAALLLYQATHLYARVPIGMNLGRALLVLVLAVLMCAGSGLLAVRKVRTADPADLF